MTIQIPDDTTGVAEAADMWSANDVELDSRVFSATSFGFSAVNSAAINATAMNNAVSSLMAAGGGRLQLPAGNFACAPITYVPSSTDIGKLSIVGMGKGATRIIPTAAPTFLLGSTIANMDFVELRDFSFWLSQDLWWDAGLITLRLTRGLRISNVELIGAPTLTLANGANSYSAYLLQLDTSYNGIIENCGARGRYVYLFEVDGVTNSGAQIDSLRFIRPQPQSTFGGAMRVGSDMHTGVFEQLKHVVVYAAGSAGDADQADETFVGAIQGAGFSNIICSTGLNFEVGDPILIGWGSTIELNRIVAFDGPGTNWTLAHPLRYGHDVGEPVIHGGVAVSLSGSCRDMVFREPHFERGVAGIFSAGSIHTVIENPYSASRETVRLLSTAGSQEMTVRGGIYSGNSSTNIIVRVTAAAATQTTRTILDGPFTKSPGGGIVAIVPYTQDGGADRHYELRRYQVAGTSQMIDKVVFDGASVNPLLTYATTTGANKYQLNPDGSIYAIGPIYLGGSATRGIYVKDGTPVGTQSAPPGSLYLQQDVTNESPLWIKMSGSATAGWAPAQAIRSGTTAARPTVTTIGQQYYDTDLKATITAQDITGTLWAGIPIGANVTHSAVQTVTSSTTVWQTLLFDTERDDVQNLHSTSSNTSRFTIAVAGVYLIGANISWVTNAAGQRGLNLMKNGATELARVMTTPAGTSNPMGMVVTVRATLAAADYVETQALQSSGGNLDVQKIANVSPEFWIQKVG